MMSNIYMLHPMMVGMYGYTAFPMFDNLPVSYLPVGSGPWRTSLDRGCHSLAHVACLETTRRHRRTNRRLGVGGSAGNLNDENVDADPRGRRHFRRAARAFNASVARI